MLVILEQTCPRKRKKKRKKNHIECSIYFVLVAILEERAKPTVRVVLYPHNADVWKGDQKSLQKDVGWSGVDWQNWPAGREHRAGQN